MSFILALLLMTFICIVREAFIMTSLENVNVVESKYKKSYSLFKKNVLYRTLKKLPNVSKVT